MRHADVNPFSPCEEVVELHGVEYINARQTVYLYECPVCGIIQVNKLDQFKQGGQYEEDWREWA